MNYSLDIKLNGKGNIFIRRHRSMEGERVLGVLLGP